jgi:hypothetical protein
MSVVVLQFGSRSGTWFALGLFAAMFGTLGWGVAREIHLRSSRDSGLGRVLGLALFVGPVVMVYASSLSGFYEAQIDGTMLRLHYLFPRVVTEISIADVAAVRPIPAIRGRQRLQIVDRSGRQYESATWHPAAIAQSAAQLKELLPQRPSGRLRVDRVNPPLRRAGRRLELAVYRSFR